MWIRLLQHFRFPEAGYSNRGRLYYPGHVREVPDSVGRVILGTWAGERPVAEQIRFEPVAESVTAGVLTALEVREPTPWMLALGLELRRGERELPWDRTLLWDGRTPLKVDLIPRGLDLLEKWELAVPIIAGTADYDTRMMFVKRNETTTAIVAQWAANGDFATALAGTHPKPLLCALPSEWINHDD